MEGDPTLTNTSEVRRVLIYTLCLNIIVAIAKVIYGSIIGSVGMLSDGFHSFFDGFNNVIGLVGIWIASHQPDEKHPYGHKKYETFFTIIIAFAIFSTCLQVLKKAYYGLRYGHTVSVDSGSFLVMLFTISINVFVMLYEIRKGKELKSDFLIADGLHTKSDIFSSLAVIIGLVLTRAGYPQADAIIGFVIAVFIGRIGYEILKKASDVLVDTVCINTSLIESVVKAVSGVKECHGIRTRGSKQSVYLDLHILLDPQLHIDKAHDIAEEVERRIKEEFPVVVDIVVHVEPDRRDRIHFK